MIKILRTADNKILRTSANVVLRRFIQEYFSVAFGLLYNWYAAMDSRKISSSDDWIVPSIPNWKTLADYLGASGDYTTNAVGGKMKKTGTSQWNTPNTGATNETSFNGVGNGQRTTTAFASILNNGPIHSSINLSTSNTSNVSLYYNSSIFACPGTSPHNKKLGNAVRLLYIGAGTPTQYIGNDLKSYPVIEIDGKFYTANNLCETRFRNNDIIPWYGAVEADFFTSSEWAALTTAACCAYNNDVANVGEGFSFPLYE